MKKEKRKEIFNVLTRIKKVSRVYQIVNEEQRGRLLENCDFLIRKLIDVGYRKEFVVGLIVGGDGFADSLFSRERGFSVSETCELIFGR